MTGTKIDMKGWMSSADPVAMMRQYRDSGVLAEELPEVVALSGIPQSVQWHPEVDTYIHTEMVLEVAARISTDPRARYAALVHDLGKGLTPVAELPKHVNHEERGVPLTEAVADRFSLPEEWKWLGAMTSRYHLLAHNIFDLKATTIVKFMGTAGFLDRDPELFEAFVVACEADKRGRLGMMDTTYPQADYMRAAFKATKAIDGTVPFGYESQVSAVKAVKRAHSAATKEAA